jgi:hypothetical protein
MIRELALIGGFVSLFASGAFARDEPVLARVTVYWPGEGGHQACWNGARLHPGHCAVDPNKIPYGSKVYFPDALCVAVDTGPSVINRKAARLAGRNARERGALVIDRFFESKEQALAWERAHPHFMTVRVMSPHATKPRQRPQPIVQPSTNPTVVTQVISPSPVPQTSAPPPPSWLRENDRTVATTLKTAARSLLTVPPSYHRRRFAANEKPDIEVPPPTCARLPIKRTRLA